ncbi:MAG: YhbY family RNA-binding protein [Oscillospiraceae bacterium]|nr:YhbY family RNA-binding protein [Oscillospiraceae bacterium]
MLTSKQRAELRSKAQSLDTIFFIGKSGISDEIVNRLGDAINARELIKLGVQENCGYSAREAADFIAPKLGADVVAVIGRKFVLWRKSNKPKPVQPKKQAVKPLYKAKAQARGKVIRNTPKSKKQVNNGR